jgi:hypothetical protein
MPEIGTMMSHVFFGVLGILVAVALFFDTLNLSSANVKRIRLMSLAVLALFFLSYFMGGDWYVENYAAEKALIKAGPWPWAHDLAMEVKEHVFFLLLLLASYLPMVVYQKGILDDRRLKVLALTVIGFMVLVGLGMDGFGAIIAMGAKLGVMAKTAAVVGG